MDSLRGQLLVAGPGLLDPNFARTVVLVAEHTDDGAMGLVLNRPSETTVHDVLPEFAELVGEGETVHVGGPVQPGAVLAVAELNDPALAERVLVGEDVALVTADLDPERLAAGARRTRVYAGYAGWGPGQLDGEVEREDWILAMPRVEDVFAEAVADVWASVLGRMGGQYALLARMPPDPSVN